MNALKISPSTIHGRVKVPPSKSQSHRAVIFGALGCGVTKIKNLLPSADTHKLLIASELLGAKVSSHDDASTITGLDGIVNGADDVIDVGNSGIALRFMTALGALSENPIVITGDHSIRHQRPMEDMIQGLKCLGVTATSTKGDGFAPIIVQGPHLGGATTVEGRDSQPVSGLLIASAFAQGDTEILVKNPGETPWVSMTLDWFDTLGLHYENDSFKRYQVKGCQRYKGFEYIVPGDWSSAAFPAAAALITDGALTLENVDIDDVQGDKRLFEIFTQMGAQIDYFPETQTLTVQRKGPLKGVVADINDCIDAITILAAVACYAEGETHIVNASVAREKECNRITSIAQELSKMNADIEITHDGLVIRGRKLQGACVDSWSDHRMAMSLAIAALGANGDSVVEGTPCIAKTYPNFIQDMKSIGAKFS